MINFYELITLAILIFALLLIFILFQFDRIKPGRRIFIYILLVVEIMICVIDLLAAFRFDNTLILIHPIYFVTLFLWYPLLYLYFKRMVFNKNELIKEKKAYFFILPAAVFIMNLAVYMPMNASEKLSFINTDLVKFNSPFLLIDYFQIFLIASYYIQFIVYIYLFCRILKAAQSNMSDKIIDKNIVLQLLKSFIVAVIIYETIILYFAFYPKEIYVPIMQLFDLVFLVFLGILGINHSTMEIQTRFRQVKVHEVETPKQNQQYLIPDSEKTEIIDLINRIFSEKKIYKDPNLKLESFAKKIHVSARKLSIVINEITENNFSYLLNHYRIEEAKRMLESSSDVISIEKIYLNTGFNSRSTFNRVFKSFTGLTPKEFLSEKIK